MKQTNWISFQIRKVPFAILTFVLLVSCSLGTFAQQSTRNAKPGPATTQALITIAGAGDVSKMELRAADPIPTPCVSEKNTTHVSDEKVSDWRIEDALEFYEPATCVAEESPTVNNSYSVRA